MRPERPLLLFTFFALELPPIGAMSNYSRWPHFSPAARAQLSSNKAGQPQPANLVFYRLEAEVGGFEAGGGLGEA